MNPSISGEAVVFAGSPRKGGNSDAAAQAFAQGVREAGGQVRVIPLRGHDLMPCRGCYGCRPDLGGRCVLPDAQAVVELYETLLRAPLLAFAAPVFFYHLPAHAKAFIDRSQPWYLRWEAGDPLMRALPRRTAHALLVSGRAEGERLFEGTLLTLKYFFLTFNVRLAPAAELRGFDGPRDLTANPAALDGLRARGTAAWQALSAAP